VPSRPTISVLVCTLAKKRRRALLERAIDSILTDQGGLGLPVVVVNGTGYDEELLRRLQARTDIKLAYRPTASLSGALRAGRRQVETPYFATLDDDDQLLPGALAIRLAPLLADATADLVVTNGYYDDGRSPARLHYPDFTSLSRDPVRSVMVKSWLQSVNALYRAERVTARDFEGMPDYLEWTWLALKLARTHSIRFLDEPTYRLNRGEPDSLSFSDAFYSGVPQALRTVLALDLPLDVRRELRRRLSASLHDVSDRARRSGDYGLAWRSHIASLGVRPSYRWLLYTRRLLLPAIDRAKDELPSETERGLPL
jgi:glycosyltransferase involved in cell wall biosynthesis